jgi:hypothetical protein
MHHRLFSWLRYNTVLPVSSLVWIAVSSAPVLAQGENQNQAPPAATTPQPSATPAVEPAQPQGGAGPAPTKPQGATPAPKPAAGNVLPETRVVAPVQRQKPRTPPQVVSRQPPAPTPTQAQVVATQNEKLDAARNTILAPVGAGTFQITHEAIEALPQGVNTGLDKVLLQAPGVSQDSAASGDLHVRNEHGNVQYRINGIQLPDGVGAFGQILDTGIVGRLALITGALPAQ